MKNGVFWYVTHLAFFRRMCRLLVTASIVPSSPILVTLMKEALSSSETSVLTRATRRNIPEDTFLHTISLPLPVFKQVTRLQNTLMHNIHYVSVHFR
jgi:ABC-type molybdate transport system permease subunit